MYEYCVKYSIGTDSAMYEEFVRTESEAKARKFIENKFSGKLVHIWNVTRR